MNPNPFLGFFANNMCLSSHASLEKGLSSKSVLYFFVQDGLLQCIQLGSDSLIMIGLAYLGSFVRDESRHDFQISTISEEVYLAQSTGKFLVRADKIHHLSRTITGGQSFDLGEDG